MATQQKLAVQVERRFAVPAQQVFDAWLDPEVMSRWMFGPPIRDEHLVRLSLDARAGGFFSIVVRRQGQEVDHVGRYLLIARPYRLVFTLGIAHVCEDQSRVSVEVLPTEEGCLLTVTHELRPHLADHLPRAEATWKKMLDHLAVTLNDRRL